MLSDGSNEILNAPKLYLKMKRVSAAAEGFSVEGSAVTEADDGDIVVLSIDVAIEASFDYQRHPAAYYIA